ncbi:MAG: hypothetical protein IJN90_04735 [Bacilli bacterium]|nr:hypothetical protein [Bacilli bacterium]
MKKIIIVLIAMFATIPTLAFADEGDFEIVSSNEKYFKTTTINFSTSYTEEISKEEYEFSNINEGISPRISSYISTEYKKMTTSILSNGSYYRYKVVLDWKKMPKVRSYDIIGIGHNSSVKMAGSPTFNLKYCTEISTCTTTTTATKQSFSNGAGASFKLPTGDFVTLQVTFYYNVEKNSNSTLYSQTAYGDYSHATSSVTANQAKQYSVDTSGIVLNSSVYNYYDSISTASVSWSGNW